MKHCNFCDVDIEDKKVHCPLCGKCIDEEDAKLGIGNHSDIYPDFKYTSNHTKVLVCKIITNSLFIATLISIIVDLLINKTMHFSLIVLIAFLCSYFSILRPIRKNMPLETMFISISLFATLFIVFMELYTHTLGWGISYTAPGIFAGLSLVCLIFMIALKFNDTDMIKPVIMNLILDLILLIILLIFKQPTLLMMEISTEHSSII